MQQTCLARQCSDAGPIQTVQRAQAKSYFNGSAGMQIPELTRNSGILGNDNPLFRLISGPAINGNTTQGNLPYCGWITSRGSDQFGPLTAAGDQHRRTRVNQDFERRCQVVVRWWREKSGLGGDFAGSPFICGSLGNRHPPSDEMPVQTESSAASCNSPKDIASPPDS
jgi:hypothetical protein